jgi:hypothetical protein
MYNCHTTAENACSRLVTSIKQRRAQIVSVISHLELYKNAKKYQVGVAWLDE